MKIQLTLHGDPSGSELHSAQHLLQMLNVPYGETSSYETWEPPAAQFEVDIRELDDGCHWQEITKDGDYWQMQDALCQHKHLGQYLVLWIMTQMSQQYTFKMRDVVSASEFLSKPPGTSGGFVALVSPKTFSGILAWLLDEIIDGWIIPPRHADEDFVITNKGRKAIKLMRKQGMLEELLIKYPFRGHYGPTLLGWIQYACDQKEQVIVEKLKIV